MAVNELKAHLMKRPPYIQSANALGQRFNVHTSTVTSLLKRLNYVQQSDGWHYQTKSEANFTLEELKTLFLVQVSDRFVEIVSKRSEEDLAKILLATLKPESDPLEIAKASIALLLKKTNCKKPIVL